MHLLLETLIIFLKDWYLQRKLQKSSEHIDIWPTYKLWQQNYDYSRQESTVDNEELIMEDEQWERGGIRTEQGEESWFIYGSMEQIRAGNLVDKWVERRRMKSG